MARTRHWTREAIPDQTGRTAVVTGANGGLGLEIVAGLAGAGATVVLACRNPDKAEWAADHVRSRHPEAKLEVAALDLADLASVAAFAEALRGRLGHLDLLVNNAGLMALDRERTADGFEMQLGVNHLGHHALTARLLPLMRDVPGSRVATMSSIGHRGGRLVLDDLMFDRRGYQRWPAYFQSKVANLLFTADLSRRLTRAGASSVAVAAHPGLAQTDLGSEGTGLSNRLSVAIYPAVTQSAAAGALPMLRALTDPHVRAGEFYGPRFGIAGAPVRETAGAHARRLYDATALAAESARLTGVELPV